MITSSYMARWNPVSSRFLSGLCLALSFTAAELRAAVGDTAAKIASRAAPEAASRFEGVVFSSEGGRVSLRLDAVPLEAFCRYLGVVHGINALASKGLSGNLNGSADGKDLERVGEILLRRNGFDPTWIGGILVVRSAAPSGTDGTPFALPQASMPFPMENAMAYPTPDPSSIPMEPSPVIVPETTPDSPPEATQGEVAMESTPVPGNPTQVDPSMPEAVQSTPSGIPMEMLPGSAQGDTVSPVVQVESPSQPENVPGMAPGAPVE